MFFGYCLFGCFFLEDKYGGFIPFYTGFKTLFFIFSDVMIATIAAESLGFLKPKKKEETLPEDSIEDVSLSDNEEEGDSVL